MVYSIFLIFQGSLTAGQPAGGALLATLPLLSVSVSAGCWLLPAYKHDYVTLWISVCEDLINNSAGGHPPFH